MRSLHLYENQEAKIGNALFCFLELTVLNYYDDDFAHRKYETMMILLIETIPLS